MVDPLSGPTNHPSLSDSEIDKIIELALQQRKDTIWKREVLDIKASWSHLALVTSGLAIPLVLSAMGRLPSSVLKVFKFAIYGMAFAHFTKLIIDAICSRLGCKGCEIPVDFIKSNRKFVIVTGVAGPIFEELVFRGALQTALHFVLKPLDPARVILLSSIKLPLSNVCAIAITAVCFGAAHTDKTHPNFYYIPTTGTGLLFGMLCNSYGLWASCFSHMLYNTSILCGLELYIEFSRRQKKS